MSYIRPLSNPEGLHVWKDCSGFVAIMRSSGREVRVDPYAFNGLLRKWAERCHEAVRCGSLTVRCDGETRYKVCLRGVDIYEQPFSLTMFEVTWDRIVRNRPRRKK